MHTHDCVYNPVVYGVGHEAFWCVSAHTFKVWAAQVELPAPQQSHQSTSHTATVTTVTVYMVKDPA